MNWELGTGIPDDWLNLNTKCSMPFCSKFSLLPKTPRLFFEIQPVSGDIVAASKHSLIANILNIGS